MKIVIFAGGVGTRLWPLSRKKSPKQFEKIVGDLSTLQHSVRRLFPLVKPDDIYISTAKKYRDIIEQQLPEVPDANFILEPTMRDNGPAVGLVTSLLAKINPDESMAIIWGDHLVKDEGAFRAMLDAADAVVQKDKNSIVFLAHTPRFANQNLGWIEYDLKPCEEHAGYNAHPLKSFKYRPDTDLVEKYTKDGEHAWNLGYFVTTPRFLWTQFQLHSPALSKDLEKIQAAYGTLSFGKVLNEVYPTLEKVSFDNAVIEKMEPRLGKVIVSDIGWSDVGAWEALKEALEKNKDDVVVKGEVVEVGCKDSLIMDYQGKKLVVGIDLEDMIVVNTDDVLIVSKKSSASKIKKLVESWKNTKYDELT
ncbi:MAG: sugar phosphate nucleotidyltransferase [bacterium]